MEASGPVPIGGCPESRSGRCGDEEIICRCLKSNPDLPDV
jgi:hypothetical protein